MRKGIIAALADRFPHAAIVVLALFVAAPLSGCGVLVGAGGATLYCHAYSC